MKSRSIAVITWRSMRAVRCLRSVAAPRSISSASSSPSGRRCLHATTHTARISRHSRQRHFTFKQRTPPPVSNSREQENYFVLKEPHPKKNAAVPLTALAALRSAVDCFHDRYRQQAHDLKNVPVTIREPAAPACAICGIPMNVQKTIPHHGMTLAHGSFHISEPVYVCPSRCRQDGKLVTARSSDLAKLLIPRSVVGYDIMVYVGRVRFVQCRQ